jgi:hypothetical protein
MLRIVMSCRIVDMTMETLKEAEARGLCNVRVYAAGLYVLFKARQYDVRFPCCMLVYSWAPLHALPGCVLNC